MVWSSNLSFTAIFSKPKPLIFLEKVEVFGFWRLKEGHMGLRWDWCATLVRKTERRD
ncbi:hypothetical protein EMIT0P260_30379 [Pseudomonas sp. IT-P260]